MEGNGLHGSRIPNAKVKSTSAKHEELLDRLICRGVLGFRELVEAEELATTVSRRADHIGLRVPRPTSFGELAPWMTSRTAPVRGSGSVSDNPNYQAMASFLLQAVACPHPSNIQKQNCNRAARMPFRASTITVILADR